MHINIRDHLKEYFSMVKFAALVIMLSTAFFLQVNLTHADLIAFYPFEGSANDASGNGNNGTNNGATLTSSGFQGSAFEFDGINNFVEIPVDINPSSLPQLTMGAWVNSDVADNLIRQVISHDNSGWDRSLGMDTRSGGGTISDWTSFNGNGILISGVDVTVGDWVFVAAVYDQTLATIRLHVNDVVVSTTGTFGTGWSTTRIGSNPSFGEFFDGRIDNLFIYNEALTEPQINDLKNNPSSLSGQTSTPTPVVTVTPVESFDDAIQLTFNSSDDREPAWSPTGNTIAFSSTSGNSSSSIWDIWAVESDGTDIRLLAEGPEIPFGLSAFLKWIGSTGDLVTNERVVFHEYLRFNLSSAGSQPVTRIATDGNDSFFSRLLLVPGGLGGDGIDVSKDGTQVAWQIRTSQNNVTPVNSEIRVSLISSLTGQNADSAGTIIAVNTNGLFGGFSFSPDGTELVVSLQGNLIIYDMNGFVVQQLTFDGNDSNPVWSKQDQIFFNSTVEGNTDIYMMDSRGFNLTRITNDDASDVQPTVSPDGTKIAFISGRSGNNDIWVIDIPGAIVTSTPTPQPTPDITPILTPEPTIIPTITPVTTVTAIPTTTPITTAIPTATETPSINGSILTADFIVDESTGDVPLNARFADISTGVPTEWLWEFGDGGASIEQNPSHTYFVAGEYSVMLTVSNQLEEDMITKEDFIVVTEPESIKSFTFNCDRQLLIGARELEILVLEPEDSEECILKLTDLKPGVTIQVSTNLRSGLRSSIEVEPVTGITDANGEIKFNIKAVSTGIDWIAWAVPDEKGEFQFTKTAFDSGLAWGMFVEVK